VLLTFAVTLLSLAQSADTTFTVQRSQRLQVQSHAGDVTVRTWTRGEVRVQMDATSSRSRVEVHQGGGVVEVRAGGRHGEPLNADLVLTVPSWMGVALNGVNGDMHIDGVQAPIRAETVQGDVTVAGGSGIVTLSSVEGSVKLTGARGKIQATSVNADVSIIGSSGEITAETVNGDVVLERVETDNLDVNTVNGDIDFDGPIRADGRYRLVTHNGDVTVGMSENTNAQVSVSTYQGEFESDFPVTIRERRGRRFSFTIGSGSASLELESFQGTIRLARPGSSR
jgi:DUF4097 and DUF4098 domain-containing protein YvlB